jgi:ribosomal protein L29
LLAAPDEPFLFGLCDAAKARGLRVSRFFEPDLGNALTAVALEPAARRLVSRLPLALPSDPPLGPTSPRGGDIMAVSTEDLRAQLVELTAERDALRAQLEAGDIPAATRWLQRKVWRQATALDKLNRAVVSQRFVLRTLDQLGRSLTGEEFRAARDRVTNPSLRDRISSPDAA